MRTAALRLLLSAVVGAVVALVIAADRGDGAAAGAHGACFSALRLLRHAVAAYEAQHGRLPGHPDAVGPASPSPTEVAGLVAAQLTQPRDARGNPDPSGPLAGLLDAVPVNPYTGESAIVVVPAGSDPVAFAAAASAGWAYLVRAAADARGPLPPGLLLPCGTAPAAALERGLASVQEIAFEIEDYRRWR